MDTKSLKRSKHSKKMKKQAEDGKPEVFVLPPDLLKRLGITLGSVNNSHEMIPDVNNAGVDAENEKINNRKQDKSSAGASILETANLMKKSVFLSPTFVSTIANAIPGEMEIASISADISKDSEMVNNNTFPANNLEMTNLCAKPKATIKASPNNDVVHNGMPIIAHNGEQNDCTQIQKCTPDRKSIDISLTPVLNIVANPVDYKSSNNNINSECTHEPNEVLSQQERKINKINIISEEIIPISKLNKIKMPHRPTLTPVTIDTKINTKVVADISVNKVDVDIKKGNVLDENEQVNSSENKCNERRSKINGETDPEKDASLVYDYIRNFGNDCHTNLVGDTNNMKTSKQVYADFKGVIDNKHKQRNNNELNSLVRSNFESENSPNLRNDIIILNTIATMFDAPDGSLLESKNDLTSAHIPNYDNLKVPNGNQIEYPDENITELITETDDNILISDTIFDHSNNSDMDIIDSNVTLKDILHSEISNGYVESCDNISRSDEDEACEHMNDQTCGHTTNNSKKECFDSQKDDCREVEKVLEIPTKQEVNHIATVNGCKLVPKNNQKQGFENYYTNGEVLQEIQSMNNDKTNVNPDSNVDNTAIIADLLKTLSKSYSEKQNTVEIKKSTSNNQKTESIKVNSNTIKSKLCIQGVEKPGGINKHHVINIYHKDLKTYERKNRLNKSSVPTIIKNKHVECSISDVFSDEINTVVRATDVNVQEFCLCNDFGRLDYYDSADLYEHIHFRQNNETFCELKLIFNIYNDNDTIVNRAEMENEYIVETLEDTEPLELHICWNHIQQGSCTEVEIVDEDKITDVSMDKQHENHAVYKPTELHHDFDTNVNNRNSNKINSNSIIIEKEDVYADSSKNNDNLTLTNIRKDLKTLISHTDTNNLTHSLKSHVDINMLVRNSDDNVKTNIVGSISDLGNQMCDAVIKNDENSPISSNTEILNCTINNHNKVYEVTAANMDIQNHNESINIQQDTTSNLEIQNNNSVNRKIDADTDTRMNIEKSDYASTPQKIIKNTRDDKSLTNNWEIKMNPKNELIQTKAENVSDCNMDIHISELNDSEKDIILLKPAETSRIEIDKKNMVDFNNQKTMLSKASPLRTYSRIVRVSEDKDPHEDVALVSDNGAPIDSEEENLSDVRKKNKVPNLKENESVSKPSSSKKRKRRDSVLNSSGTVEDTNERDPKKSIKCAVCHKLLSSERKWENHVIGQHQYIAWKVGDTFDLNNADLHKKLRESVKIAGLLKCTFCNTEIRQVTKFIAHVQTCLDLMKLQGNNEDIEEKVPGSLMLKLVKCAVCAEEVQESEWLKHIKKSHNYLAWIDGEEPLNLDDEKEVWSHLLQIIREHGDLQCHKCGLSRKRAKLYLSHMETCDGEGVEETLATTMPFEDKKSVKCGICEEEISIMDWYDHIGRNHNYLAWEYGTTPLNLDDEEAVRDHLYQILKQKGGLTCYKCGVVRKRIKVYQSHVEKCEGLESQLNDTTVSIDLDKSVKVDVQQSEYTCGICKQVVPGPEWIGHIGKEHDYMAWEEGTPQIDLEDPEAVRSHLYKIAKENRGLICNKCGVVRKYVKSYMEHIKECTGPQLESSMDVKLDASTEYHNEIVSVLNNNDIKTVVCGVCHMSVEKGDWFKHIGTAHQYMAWMEGHTSFDVNDADEVQTYLYGIVKLVDGFVCDKCGLLRKYAKPYLNHISTCRGNSSVPMFQIPIGEDDLVECAICHKQILSKHWRDHAMDEHYNVAWIVGESGFDLNSPYTVEPYIKEYQTRHHNLVCKTCGVSRVSRVGFYAHILVCGKTEEEMEQFKETCGHCNNKYLRIYKSQHMTAHREAEMAKERKLLAAKEKKKKSEEPVELLSGRRKAAVKAKTVIEKYSSNVEEGCHRCNVCGFTTEEEKELTDHVCVEIDSDHATDSDESVNLDEWSEVESVDTDIDSNLSEEEQVSAEAESKKKRQSDIISVSNKIQRIPFPTSNPRSYLKQSGKEYIEMYWSKEILFKQWLSCEYEEVNEKDVLKYMPPMAVSCNIRLGESNGEWRSYKRFEARKEKCVCAFVGATIQCISWVPVKHDDWPTDNDGAQVDKASSACATSDSDKNFLAVACHLAEDIPRSNWDHTVDGHGLIQIWDYGNFATVPELALCIAVEYGTVWAFDWCPSGARDVDAPLNRLGLLAVACSNGSAYIFSIPYPSTISNKNNLFYKLKPVVELRLAMGTDRIVYQATSIKWSPQKGHEHILVGYSDGTVAHYDLNSESPLLRAVEDDVTILYPFHDERILNACIEGVDSFPLADGSVALGGGGAGGGAALRRPHAGAALTHVPVGAPAFQPHWPSLVLGGDEALLNTAVNELEWWGGGRRLGGLRASCGCLRCGRVVAAGGQLLRLIRVHPVFPEINKLVVGVVEMIPLMKKRKLKNDDLSMVVEPMTYEETIKKYGIEYKMIFGKDRASQQKVTSVPRQPYPERFPLSDVNALAFCPSQQHHDKLAVAVHAGFVLIMHL